MYIILAAKFSVRNTEPQTVLQEKVINSLQYNYFIIEIKTISKKVFHPESLPSSTGTATQHRQYGIRISPSKDNRTTI